ncbi:transposase [Streptomyces sp. WM6378]|uniref:transposase n=1 Tax=Streptomyces sp. WM6378 TaxID=1415557 RepID=UPI001F3D1A75|nr:transposase [Streptomyces sp. WM6378]
MDGRQGELALACFDLGYIAPPQHVRRDRIEPAKHQVTRGFPLALSRAAVVRRLACLRGIDTLSAFGLAVEVGDWHQFTGATIGAYLGLVPSELSSGPNRTLGPITKTGNTHARRLLVEAAWQHCQPYRGPGAALRRRMELAPAPVRQRADLGNRRLHQRWVSFLARKKNTNVAAVAIARELAGWCWSLAMMEN